jgi:hypothetical protein
MGVTFDAGAGGGAGVVAQDAEPAMQTISGRIDKRIR